MAMKLNLLQESAGFSPVGFTDRTISRVLQPCVDAILPMFVAQARSTAGGKFFMARVLFSQAELLNCGRHSIYCLHARGGVHDDILVTH